VTHHIVIAPTTHQSLYKSEYTRQSATTGGFAGLPCIFAFIDADGLLPLRVRSYPSILIQLPPPTFFVTRSMMNVPGRGGRGGLGQQSSLGAAQMDWELPTSTPPPATKCYQAVHSSQFAEDDDDDESLFPSAVTMDSTHRSTALDTMEASASKPAPLATSKPSLPTATAVFQLDAASMQYASSPSTTTTATTVPGGKASINPEVTFTPTSGTSAFSFQSTVSMLGTEWTQESAPKKPFSAVVGSPVMAVPEPISGERLVPPGRADDMSRFQNLVGVAALHRETGPGYSEDPFQFKQSSSPPPLQPQTLVVPKGELHSLYGKAPRRKIISNENYHTWHNSGQAHMLKWSSAFVCPLSGEIFLSANYPGSGACAPPLTHPESTTSRPLWFSKKTQAEHGAAALAYDCLVYRDYQKNQGAVQGLMPVPVPRYISLEKPYTEEEAVYELPPGLNIPLEDAQKIQAQQAEIRHRL
jgi:hypothetical protein